MTDLREKADQVERRALVSETAALVAHELRNPLAPIRGYAELLQQKLDAVDPKERPLFEKALRIMQQEVRRLEERVSRWMALTQSPEISVAFEVGAIVREVIALLEGRPSPVRIELDEAGDIEIEGDPDRVRGAFLNLIKNALEATESSGGNVVVVRVSGVDRCVEILDEGPGFPPEALEFRPFFTSKVGGTGLGLAIARTAILGLGGRMLVGSRPSGGSSVSVCF